MWGLADSAQLLIEHGHSHEQIMAYPPHLFGRYIVAVRRVSEQRDKAEVLNSWIAHNSSFEEIKKYIQPEGTRKKQPEISPEMSRKAAIGLMNALQMG